jgi:hypothetical protein
LSRNFVQETIPLHDARFRLQELRHAAEFQASAPPMAAFDTQLGSARRHFPCGSIQLDPQSTHIVWRAQSQ